MKKIITLILLVLILVSCSNDDDNELNDVSQNINTQVSSLTINDIRYEGFIEENECFLRNDTIHATRNDSDFTHPAGFYVTDFGILTGIPEGTYTSDESNIGAVVEVTNDTIEEDFISQEGATLEYEILNDGTGIKYIEDLILVSTRDSNNTMKVSMVLRCK